MKQLLITDLVLDMVQDTSIRIGNDTAKNNKGYFEDRRPASNMDPYIVTSLLLKTSCQIVV